MNLPKNRQNKHEKKVDLDTLVGQIQSWGEQLGFQQVGISDIDLDAHEERLAAWLQQNYHGDMDYMQRHGSLRSHPEELHTGTIRVISARMDYLPETSSEVEDLLKQPAKGVVSRYALGRDYHKMMRKRLQSLARQIEQHAGPMGYRVFVDSAPVLEKALAEKAGLGWIGKHTNLINRQAGRWFFLGEIFTDLPLPTGEPVENHCGDCTKCIDICPTQAIVAPYKLDARRCISYLTIELKDSIPEEFRSQMGNRIYGCDDCQLVCPWNRFARFTAEADFAPRHGLDTPGLIELFEWTEQQFLERTQGSAIRRIGHHRWLRNIAVALGNAPTTTAVIEALHSRSQHDSPMVREHIQWALYQHRAMQQE